jgi:DNA-binding transcriptional LysR family regulator
MLSVTLRRIEHAVAVLDHGGVTAAARALNVSQPSLSVSVSQLETELGRPLFARQKGRGIKPTSFGVSFLKDAKGLIAQARHLMDRDSVRDGLSGNIAFGCFDDLAPFHLSRVAEKMASDYPGITVTFEVRGFDALARELGQGTLDLALTYDLGLGDQVERQFLAATVPHAMVAKSHRFASLPSISLKELAGEPLVLTNQEFSWQHILDLYRTRGLEPKIGFKASSFELQRSFVGRGLGVAVCYANPSVAQTYDGMPLQILEISDELPAQSILLAHMKNNPPTAAMQRMIDVVRGVVQANG